MTDEPLRIDEDQLEALGSPVRESLVRELSSFGPQSIRDLAARLGRPAASLYHHVARLQQVGLVREIGARPGLRRPEALFALVADRLESSTTTTTPRGRRALAKVAAGVARQAARAALRATAEDRARTSGPQRNLAARCLAPRLDAEGLARLNALIEQFARDAAAIPPSPAGEPVVLALVLAPGRPVS